MKKSTVFIGGFVLLLLGIVVGSALASASEAKTLWGRYFGLFFSSAEIQSPLTGHDHEISKYPQISLSDQALENIGIGTRSWKSPHQEDFPKTQTFPAILVERPGRSTFQIPSSVSGVISKVYCEQGERVKPGQALFDIVLAHEDLIQCQTALLALFQKRYVIEKELKRLEPLVANAVAPKSIREYELQKIEIDSQIASQKAVLLLHGLPKDRVESLEKHLLDTIQGNLENDASVQDLLIRELTVFVPNVTEDGFVTTALTKQDPMSNAEQRPADDISLVLERLSVEKGKLVSQGETLCQISNFSCLYVEGKAFARDEALLNQTFIKQHHLWIVFDDRATAREVIPGLHIKMLDNRIDSTNRTLNFYVELDNRLLGPKERWEGPQHAGHSHLDTDKELLHWRFKPGQRCEVNIEYETVPGCFVVPVEAVAEEGANAFVFALNGSSKWKPDGTKQLTADEIERGEPYQLFKVWEKRPIVIKARDRMRIAFQAVDVTYVDPSEPQKLIHALSVNASDMLAQSGANQLNDALNSGSGKLQSTCPCGNH